MAIDLRALEDRSLSKEALPSLLLEMEHRIIQRIQNAPNIIGANKLEKQVKNNSYWVSELKSQMKHRIKE